MKTPELAAQIIRAVREAVDIPLTVKFRKGWDSGSVNAVEFAKMAEACGADAIAIHGRTRAQMYAPTADWEIIRQVKEAVSIPVIGNGDVDSVDSAVRMYEETGCDLVMIGRGALGNPFLFRQIKEYREYGQVLTHPTLEERVEVMLRHIRLLCDIKGEYIGMKEARKHATWYFKGSAVPLPCGGRPPLSPPTKTLSASVSSPRRFSKLEPCLFLTYIYIL